MNWVYTRQRVHRARRWGGYIYQWSSQPRAKEEKVNLAFVNHEGRPSTLRHSNLSFRSNISPVFVFQNRVELQLISLEVLNRTVIFENISKLSLDRAKICSGEKVTVHKGTHFFTDDKVSPSLTIFHLPCLALQNTTRLKSGVTFTCFFCFLWKLFCLS